ncbi:MAG TPA: SpoIIE family protein phosphatase [Anaerolineaceae bacterium]|nr:SpoIIE family protein phosphatase [Anaerolineaceae bacterium]
MEVEDQTLRRIATHWTDEIDSGKSVKVHAGQTDPLAHFYAPGTCSACQDTGRAGEVAVFDVFCVEGKTKPSIWPASLLPLDAYVYQLAVQGDLALDDYLWIESDHLRRTYQLFSQSKRANQDTDAALLRKVIELEAANRVLRNRTEVLLSLQDLDQALTASASLDDLAPLVCREVSSLCGADRVILYYLRDQETAEVLAVQGWPRYLIHRQLERTPVTALVEGDEPGPYKQLPPGVEDPPLGHNGDKLPILVGMRVPLLAQDNPVGLMIVHSTKKKAFSPAEMTLLQTYANQAAVAIQRAGLIEELRSKIAQLEEAQTALVEKEKIEHELELARQVQQSMLPRTFPVIPGFSFAARNQPARQVGGDFFDLIVLDDDHFGVAIADVSDKGMPAALFMALSRSLLLAEARRDLSPRNVLSNVNRLLMELGEDRQFVSIFYAVFELSSRKVCYCRAGHEIPFLIRGDQIQPLQGIGTILGVLEPEEMELSEEQVIVEPGDRIVLYTDGLTDSVNPANQFFGMSRLTKTVQANAKLPAQAFCAATFDEIAAYQGSAGQFDDMTMLVVEVT